jgi:hypothetical protein
MNRHPHPLKIGVNSRFVGRKQLNLCPGIFPSRLGCRWKVGWLSSF